MFTNKKGISPVVATALLLVVAVVAVVGFQGWYNSFQSDVFSDVSSKSSSTTEISIEGIFGDDLYLNAGNNLTITTIEIEGIDCSISGTYSELSKINISSCLDLVTSSIVKINIFTGNSVLSNSLYIS
jgi:flagellin-like protein